MADLRQAKIDLLPESGPIGPGRTPTDIIERVSVCLSTGFVPVDQTGGVVMAWRASSSSTSWSVTKRVTVLRLEAIARPWSFFSKLPNSAWIYFARLDFPVFTGTLSSIRQRPGPRPPNTDVWVRTVRKSRPPFAKQSEVSIKHRVYMEFAFLASFFFSFFLFLSFYIFLETGKVTPPPPLPKRACPYFGKCGNLRTVPNLTEHVLVLWIKQETTERQPFEAADVRIDVAIARRLRPQRCQRLHGNLKWQTMITIVYGEEKESSLVEERPAQLLHRPRKPPFCLQEPREWPWVRFTLCLQ